MLLDRALLTFEYIEDYSDVIAPLIFMTSE
jgi:hypothetical protein